MPYIAPDLRPVFEESISFLAAEVSKLPIEKQDGAVNYVVTRLLHEIYGLKASPSYFVMNRAVGTLEAIKMELYRRVCAPYEDEAAQRNGDV